MVNVSNHAPPLSRIIPPNQQCAAGFLSEADAGGNKHGGTQKFAGGRSGVLVDKGREQGERECVQLWNKEGNPECGSQNKGECISS